MTHAVVTDIENSTVAWESLDAEVMDACINAHNMCVRRVMRKHHGFESATEGGLWSGFVVDDAHGQSGRGTTVASVVGRL